MNRIWRFVPLVAAVFASACFSPKIPVVTCGTGEDECPPGTECGPDGFCREPGQEGAPDAMTRDVDASGAMTVARPCLSDYPEEHAGHRYHRMGQARTQRQALARCAQDGAHLSVVDDAQENQFLHQMIPDTSDTGSNDHWIGLDDFTVEGSFVWITRADSVYRNWNQEEPDDFNDDEDCAVMRPNGQWDDTNCGNGRPFFCECDPDYQPPELPACLDGDGYNILSSGRRYRVGKGSITWDQASAICAQDGAHLVAISDQTENSGIHSAIETDAWIGYREPGDHTGEGRNFTWDNGAPSDQDENQYGWADEQPDQPDHHCAILGNVSGRWWDVLCTRTVDVDGDNPMSYVCECDPLPR